MKSNAQFSLVESRTAIDLDLNGKVKSIKTIKYAAIDSNGVIKKGPLNEVNSTNRFYTLHPNGQIATRIHFNEKLEKTYEINYDSTGKPLNEIHFINNKVKTTSKYRYNKDQELISRCQYEDADSTCWLYIFNDKHQKVKENQIDKSGKIPSSREYIYDEFGNIVEIWSRNGSKETKSILAYDVDSNLTEYCMYNKEGLLLSCKYYEYDEYGNRTQYTTLVDGQLKNKTVITYDENGNRLSYKRWNEYMELVSNEKYVYENDLLTEIITVNESGGNTRNETYLYNEQGDRTAIIYHFPYGGESFREEMKYTYDSHGNWTRQVLYNSGRVYALIEREIKYYTK